MHSVTEDGQINNITPRPRAIQQLTGISGNALVIFFFIYLAVSR